MINTVILAGIYLTLIAKPIYNEMEINNEIKKVTNLKIKNLKITKTLFSVKIEYYKLNFSIRKKEFNSDMIFKVIEKYSKKEDKKENQQCIITAKGIYHYND